MPKRTISFKPTPECEVHLAELMERWDCDRTAALVRAVASAAQHDDEHTSLIDTTDEANLAYAGERLRENAKLLRASGIDRDKIAAFQNKTGMGRAGKRK